MSKGRYSKFTSGMNEIYVPPGGENHVEAVANVVFIHGLFGHPWRTWADEGIGDQEKPFWPQTLLPVVVKNVRIFSFGYDADIAKFMSSASLNTVFHHGTNLLNDLTSLMDRDRGVGVLGLFVLVEIG